MRIDVTMHIASEADLDALVRLAVAFRDHVGQSTPSAEEFCSSIALLLHEANTEFFLASTPTGAASDMCSVATATQSGGWRLRQRSKRGCSHVAPAIGRGSPPALSRLCPHPLQRRLQFGLKSPMAPELLAHIVQQRPRLLGFTQEAQQFSA